MGALCRDCGATPADGRPSCPACGGRRIVCHPELFTLAIAHVDCDAFFAAVEKRDRPELADRPVIVGGGARGVVATACYIARLSGVASAMPMFRARALCPDAVVIAPDMAKYAAAARRIRALMGDLTPLVEPLSIDEAALDLAGTEALHGAPPAVTLARLALAVEREVGVTVSIGLAANRLLAKIAAGRDKPRGFAVIGAEAPALLAPAPVGLLPGIGAVAAARLAARGIRTLGQIQRLGEGEARALFGADGPAMVARARGEDARPVVRGHATRSLSAETTFATDLAAGRDLELALWPLVERLAGRLRAADLAAAGVVLKLRTAGFATRTRAVRLGQPTRLTETLFAAAAALLAREADGTRFRLLGIAAQPLPPGGQADAPDLADPELPRRRAREEAIHALRERFGPGAIRRGRGW